MYKYRHKRTNTIIETPCVCKGDDWVLLKQKKPLPVEPKETQQVVLEVTPEEQTTDSLENTEVLGEEASQQELNDQSEDSQQEKENSEEVSKYKKTSESKKQTTKSKKGKGGKTISPSAN